MLGTDGSDARSWRDSKSQPPLSKRVLVISLPFLRSRIPVLSEIFLIGLGSEESEKDLRPL